MTTPHDGDDPAGAPSHRRWWLTLVACASVVAVAAIVLALVSIGGGGGGGSAKHSVSDPDRSEAAVIAPLRAAPKTQWTADLHGTDECDGTDTSTVYAVSHVGDHLEAIAIARSNGKERWRVRLNDIAGNCAIAGVADGAVIAGSGAQAATALLLDRGTGQTRWTSHVPSWDIARVLRIGDSLLLLHSDEAGEQATTIDTSNGRTGRMVSGQTLSVGSTRLYAIDDAGRVLAYDLKHLRRVARMDAKIDLETQLFGYPEYKCLGFPTNSGLIAEVRGKVLVAVGESVVAYDTAGHPVWRVRTSAGTISSLVAAGSNAFASGSRGAAMVTFGGSAARPRARGTWSSSSVCIDGAVKSGGRVYAIAHTSNTTETVYETELDGTLRGAGVATLDERGNAFNENVITRNGFYHHTHADTGTTQSENIGLFDFHGVAIWDGDSDGHVATSLHIGDGFILFRYSDTTVGAVDTVEYWAPTRRAHRSP